MTWTEIVLQCPECGTARPGTIRMSWRDRKRSCRKCASAAREGIPNHGTALRADYDTLRNAGYRKSDALAAIGWQGVGRGVIETWGKRERGESA